MMKQSNWFASSNPISGLKITEMNASIAFFEIDLTVIVVLHGMRN